MHICIDYICFVRQVMWVGGHRTKCSKTLAPILTFLILDVQCLQAVLASLDGFRHGT